MPKNKEDEGAGSPPRISAVGSFMKTGGGLAVGTLVVEKEFVRRSFEVGGSFPPTWFPFREPNGRAN